MGKSIPDAIIDLQLDQAEGDQIHVCSAEPTTAAEATTTYNLATATAGTFTKANGDTSGRKNTQAGVSGVSITTSGTATHVAETASSGTVLKKVTTVTSQALTSGGTVDIGSYSHEIGDPS